MCIKRVERSTSLIKVANVKIIQNKIINNKRLITKMKSLEL